jgi:hypothetical protein
MKTKNKASPKKNGRAQTNRLNSPGSVTPSKPRKPQGVTKSSLQNAIKIKHETRQLAKHNLRVLKEFWWVAYQDILFVGKGAVGITMRHSDEVIQIALLLIAMVLQWHIHSAERTIR